MFVLSQKSYDFLKNVVQLILPGFGTLYFSLAAIWGFPAADQVVATCAAIATFLGIVLRISSSTFEKLEKWSDGEMQIQVDDEEGTVTPKLVMNEDFDLLADSPRISIKRVVKRGERPLEAAPPEG